MSKLPGIEGETRQNRSIGFIAASLIAHSVLLLAAVLVTQIPLQTPVALGSPNQASNAETTMVDVSTPPGAATQAQAQSKPESKDVMLADPSDAQAVSLPKKQQTETVTKAEAPKPVRAKKSAATKLPAAKKEPVQAQDDGDIDVQAAIKAAREKQQDDDVKPIDVADNNEPKKAETAEATAQTDSDDQKAETKEAEPAPVAPVVAETTKAEGTPEKTETKSATTAAAVVTPVAPVASAAAQAVPAAAPKTAATSSAGSMTPTTAQNAKPALTQAPTAQGYATRGAGAGSMRVPLGARIRDASELMAMPGNPSPIYPQEDRLASRQGTAVVIGQVRTDGSMATVKLERSSGSTTLDASALTAFRNWRFKAGQEGLVRKPFQFQLAGDPRVLQSQLRH